MALRLKLFYCIFTILLCEGLYKADELNYGYNNLSEILYIFVSKNVLFCNIFLIQLCIFFISIDLSN